MSEYRDPERLKMLDEAQQVVYAYCKEHPNDLTATDVIAYLSEATEYDTELIRDAFWHLLDRRELRFDRDWRIEIPA